MYPDTRLFIGGHWRDGAKGGRVDVQNPATGGVIGAFAQAEAGDIDLALDAANQGFLAWRGVPAERRASVLHAGAALLRERVDAITAILTAEQGKPLREARLEILQSADIIDWLADEGRRVYGRCIPSRLSTVRQLVLKEPVGPVAAFTPWNFPISQAARKLGAALASGCSVVLKAAEDTPASTAALVSALAEGGLPDGALNLVYGVPSDISTRLIEHPNIRKISFTGSIPVGKLLAGMAGQHMKRVTMELGGHAPVFVAGDADVESTVALMVGSKFRNAGQVCVSPTRFLIERSLYPEFVERFSAEAAKLKVGDGAIEDNNMGPLVSERRVEAVDSLVQDARKTGGRIVCGGHRVHNDGSFYAPTVIADAHPGMRAMNDEPFGPIALMMPVASLDEAIEEANRLPVGLASYAFTNNPATAMALTERIRVGMLSINHLGLALPETPFGGVLDSGYGSEGGAEALEAYLSTKFVTHMTKQLSLGS